jgi:hypothetical protein
MTETDEDTLIRQYAADEITWSALRTQGFHNYVDVLAELGKRGLHPLLHRWTGRMLTPASAGVLFCVKPSKIAKPPLTYIL